MPGRPLIRAVETSEDTPAIERPSTATIRSPGRIPAFCGGRAGQNGGDPQAALDLGDGQAHTRELPEFAASNWRSWRGLK